ncbi:MAG TPA: hypothetical protein VKB69_06740 [Micromonosporaceae bacterium]|nr:hypothetical protein [Micromonosporaceae bacterium]
MSQPPRRRIDLLRLPAAARYAIALAVLAVVVLVAIAAAGGTNNAAGWYTVGVKIGAVVLLVALAGWLVWRIANRRRPR